MRMAMGFYNGWSPSPKLNFGERDRVGATGGPEKGRRGSQDCFGPSEKDTGFHQVHLSYHSFPLQRYSNYRCLNYRGTPLMVGRRTWDWTWETGAMGCVLRWHTRGGVRGGMSPRVRHGRVLLFLLDNSNERQSKQRRW
jgi:hypothetical protein